MNRIHFIGIGGTAMTNLAIALKKTHTQKQYIISGSDDHIEDPTFSMLKNHYLLPEHFGWFPQKITPSIDTIVIGAKITADNPELIEARKLNIPVMPYHEYVAQFSKEKTRIVVTGAYGKNTIAAMVLHVLSYFGKEIDFMLTAPVFGYSETIRLSESDTILIEAGEELASQCDTRARLEVFQANIGLITGISWEERKQQFGNYEEYVELYRNFIQSIPADGTLIYNTDDVQLREIIAEEQVKFTDLEPYTTHPYEVFENRTYLKIAGGRLPVLVFGEHNMRNVSAAQKICLKLGLSNDSFYRAFKSMKGSNKHLQILAKNANTSVYFDYTYSPIQLKYTIKAIREQYKNRGLVACLELNANDSIHDLLHKDCEGALNLADEKLVYYNPDLFEQKGLPHISKQQIRDTFGSNKIKVFTAIDDLLAELFTMSWEKKNLLFVSANSGTELNMQEITKRIMALGA
ncbi:MAG: Mur ligase domain-containing protein [Bacteroidales bacterium]|jgi:UDP-N-acetylmuramate: L-alanyl-gamma-D-glutamyl-meso-diaminopimelate ligase|nr:Mur ligase domain-containing protein [Bacteroidales bacterium]